jgi:transcriptional regulator with XRE-family HTH domain
MSSENIGSVIHALRKEKKITQEALAEAVGVSAQAVSRWECGGMPDIYLIPVIADFFGVTIDKLFSRDIINYDNIETIVAEYIASLDADKVYKAWFDLFWTTQKAIMGTMPKHSLALERMSEDKDQETDHYSVINDEHRDGFSTLLLSENQQYGFLMRKPKDYSKLILPVEEYQRLFAVLGDIDCLNVLFFLYKRENSRFTEKLLIDNLNITKEKAQEIIDSLIKYKWLHAEELELDEHKMTIYSFSARHSFIPLLLFAREIIQIPTNFSATSGLDNGLRIK